MIGGYFENGKGDQNQHYLVYETSINQAKIGSDWLLILLGSLIFWSRLLETYLLGKLLIPKQPLYHYPNLY